MQNETGTEKMQAERKEQQEEEEAEINGVRQGGPGTAHTEQKRKEEQTGDQRRHVEHQRVGRQIRTTRPSYENGVSTSASSQLANGVSVYSQMSGSVRTGCENITPSRASGQLSSKAE